MNKSKKIQKSQQDSIIRVVHGRENPYAQISRAALEDVNLSWEARGVLAYLLAKPANWTVKTADLESKGGCGRDRILRILKELETQGYLSRDKSQDSAGHWIWEKLIYESPTLNPSFSQKTPQSGFPFTVEPATVEPDTGNPTIYNKEGITKESFNKKELKRSLVEKVSREREGGAGGNARKARSTSKRRPTLSDEDFLASLQANPAYLSLNVRKVYGKMCAWCELKGIHPTRTRLLNWLNREDVPMAATPLRQYPGMTV